MALQEYAPHPLLEPFIRCYWFLEVASVGIVRSGMRILSEGIETTFNLSSPFVDKRDGVILGAAKNGKTFGPMSVPIEIWPSGKVEVFGVCYRPGGGYPFFRFPAHELQNKRISTSELWGTAGEALIDRIVDPSLTHKQRIDILDAHFLQLLGNYSKQLPEDALYAANLIAARKGMVSIDQLADCVGLGRRQLERKFKECIGLSPKQLCRSFRFKNVLWAIHNSRDSLVEIALRCGYYDQSHFIRDFKCFAGKSPSKYFADQGQPKDYFYVELLKNSL